MPKFGINTTHDDRLSGFTRSRAGLPGSPSDDDFEEEEEVEEEEGGIVKFEQ